MGHVINSLRGFLHQMKEFKSLDHEKLLRNLKFTQSLGWALINCRFLNSQDGFRVFFFFLLEERGHGNSKELDSSRKLPARTFPKFWLVKKNV